ncbi:helix-turn-helix domain-containing protein [Kineosporia sp. NBRC 101731]|uniref:helix-turn-helix domain-containing protein n=1 Tax=Kineosporia sp. NBRC 101731 TaxID=3032199 RepID=UPI0024A0501D|nr:helix-turn-helix domain-containing protein [Kineosporia sp. NBRC 101731]GLY30838.1 transcriptional regulator [Kineosporia sp. NBRC 101731]
MSEAPHLAELLRSWRTQVSPADVGLPFRPDSRRTPGLRREEVAWLAGISPDYVKRLEQGRAHPSSSVLKALARTLRISDAEYEMACRIAGYAAQAGGQVPQTIGPSVQRLLDRFADTPIAVFDAAWTLLEHNDIWAAMSGDGRNPRPGRAENLVWRSFLGDPGRMRHPDLAGYRASLIADLRDVAARYPADRELAALIGELRRSSDEFARLWTSTAAAHFGNGNESKTLDHPVVGELHLDCDVLSVHGADLRIIVFSAAPGSESAQRLRLLSVLGTQDMTASR